MCLPYDGPARVGSDPDMWRQSNYLSTSRNEFHSAPGGVRTHDTRCIRPLLSPLSYEGLSVFGLLRSSLPTLTPSSAASSDLLIFAPALRLERRILG